MNTHSNSRGSSTAVLTKPLGTPAVVRRAASTKKSPPVVAYPQRAHTNNSQDNRTSSGARQEHATTPRRLSIQRAGQGATQAVPCTLSEPCGPLGSSSTNTVALGLLGQVARAPAQRMEQLEGTSGFRADAAVAFVPSSSVYKNTFLCGFRCSRCQHPWVSAKATMELWFYKRERLFDVRVWGQMCIRCKSTAAHLPIVDEAQWALVLGLFNTVLRTKSQHKDHDDTESIRVKTEAKPQHKDDGSESIPVKAEPHEERLCQRCRLLGDKCWLVVHNYCLSERRIAAN
eukprot:m51a1_g2179 hypothetical protein (287) ;mRNA; f:94978-95892